MIPAVLIPVAVAIGIYIQRKRAAKIRSLRRAEFAHKRRGTLRLPLYQVCADLVGQPGIQVPDLLQRLGKREDLYRLRVGSHQIQRGIYHDQTRSGRSYIHFLPLFCYGASTCPVAYDEVVSDLLRPCFGGSPLGLSAELLRKIMLLTPPLFYQFFGRLGRRSEPSGGSWKNST